MFGSVVKLEAFHDAPGLSRRERLVKGRHTMSIQIVEDHADHSRVGVGHVHHPAHLMGEVLHGAPLGDGQVAPARQGFTGQEDISGAAAAILIVLPPRSSRLSGEFVARMEDVLDLYQPEYNPERPVVCFDETSRQLTGEVRPPIEAAPGRVARYDTEYQRNGTRNLFMICEPKGGWRHVEVTERRTAVDFAHQMRWLVDEAYPDAKVVRLVLDNLNTHQLGSLYEAFEPCEARRIAKRLEFHYTPTHGSWLNMAEIELSVFSRGCLNRRISDEPELRREVAALERERNAAKSAIDWRFTTQDARRKLQHIYPTKPD